MEKFGIESGFTCDAEESVLKEVAAFLKTTHFFWSTRKDSPFCYAVPYK